MKKLKVLLSVVLTCVLALSLAGCATNDTGDGGDGNGSSDVIVPVDISLNTENAKTRYSAGEAYTAEGLVVTITEHNETQDTDLAPRSVELTDENLTIDSSSFDNTATGKYEIVVSYEANDESVEASYEVSVKVGAGVVIEKNSTSYDFSVEGTEIDLSDMSVYIVGAYGEKGSALSASDYEVSAYLGNEEVALTEGKLIVDKAGAYNIWASVNDYTIPGTSQKVDISGFVLVYVMDSLQSITLNAEGSVLTQEAGSDVISDTWTFTATYSSGETKQLTSEDVEIEGLDTKTPTTAGSATVTYTEQNAKGELISVDTTVAYTITERQGEVSGYAGIGFDNMQTGTFTAAYAEATNGSLSISDANSILLGATVAHESTDKFSIIDSAQSITTSAGNVNLAKAFVTEGSSRINGDGVARRMIKIELGEGTYNIRVWASVKSTNNKGRYVKAYNGPSGSTFDLSSEGTVVGNELTTAVQLCELNEVASGTWYIGGSASIVIHYIEVVAAAPQEQVYAIDFTDTTQIAANAQLAGTDITKAVPIKDIAGNDTGFSVTKSSSSSGKYNLIGEQNNMQVLQFQGSAKETQNSLVVNVAAGEVTVVVTYFSGTAGRYVKVVNEGLDTVVATDAELTTADKAVKTRTITFTLAEATNIYIGSASSGIYLCKVEITVK